MHTEQELPATPLPEALEKPQPVQVPVSEDISDLRAKVEEMLGFKL